MNAVVKSVSPSRAAANLAAHRERVREIHRAIEPLNGRASGLKANMAAAKEEREHAVAELADLQRAPSPNYPAIAAKEAQVRTLDVRVTDLEAAAKEVEARRNELGERLRKLNEPHLPLMHAVTCEQMEAVIEQRNEALRNLNRLEEEIDAYARAADQISRDHAIQYPNSGHSMPVNLAGELENLRALERERAVRRGWVNGQLPQRVVTRIAEILREIEAE